MIRDDVYRITGMILVLFAVLFLVGHCAGCGLFGTAVSTVAYERDLDACLVEGRKAHSLAVYEQCATEADKRHGLKDGGVE